MSQERSTSKKPIHQWEDLTKQEVPNRLDEVETPEASDELEIVKKKSKPKGDEA